MMNFSNHWGWICTLDSISNSDPTKWDEICEWGAIKFLNTASYFNDKQTAEYKMQKELMK